MKWVEVTLKNKVAGHETEIKSWKMLKSSTSDHIWSIKKMLVSAALKDKPAVIHNKTHETIKTNVLVCLSILSDFPSSKAQSHWFLLNT